MNNQEIFFMAGFPRAGSTLLMNILNQNPKFHGTATSGLITSLINIKENWRKSELYLSNGESYVYPRIQSMMKGLIEGFYQNELNNNIIPIDKNRAWTGNFDLLDEIFDTKVKFIYPIRHIIDCLISLEKVERKSSIIRMPKDIKDISTIGRAENMLSDEGILGLPIIYLREILYRKEWDRLLLVPFNDLLNYPVLTMKRLYYQMELDYFNHDLNNIKQSIYEEDIHHNYAPNSLHKIKEGKLQSPNPRDLTIYNDDFIKKIENEIFKDITDFINTNTNNI
jgi:sulfotransferase